MTDYCDLCDQPCDAPATKPFICDDCLAVLAESLERVTCDGEWIRVDLPCDDDGENDMDGYRESHS